MLAPLVTPPAALRHLPPFLDPAPYARARAAREQHRAALAVRWGLDPAKPWLLTVAMMREDVKQQSYLLLAGALGALPQRRWQLLVVGDGAGAERGRGRLRTPRRPGGVRGRFAGARPRPAMPAICSSGPRYGRPTVSRC